MDAERTHPAIFRGFLRSVGIDTSPRSAEYNQTVAGDKAFRR